MWKHVGNTEKQEISFLISAFMSSLAALLEIYQSCLCHIKALVLANVIANVNKIQP